MYTVRGRKIYHAVILDPLVAVAVFAPPATGGQMTNVPLKFRSLRLVGFGVHSNFNTPFLVDWIRSGHTIPCPATCGCHRLVQRSERGQRCCCPRLPEGFDGDELIVEIMGAPPTLRSPLAI